MLTTRLRLSIALLALILVGTTAHAHGLRVSVQPEIDALRGQALYADGTAARGERVELHELDGAGAPVATAVTDADGRFRLPASTGRTYRVVVEGDEGHRAEAIAVLAAPAAGAEVSAAIRAEIAPLREDLARLEHRIRMGDVIGGVGFIVGLFGAAAWWMAHRRR